jgi:hypothetical protein
MEAGEVAVRALVAAGGDGSPGLELVDQALDGVPLLLEVRVMADGSRPWNLFFRLAVWSCFSKMTASIWRLRRWVRLPRDE